MNAPRTRPESSSGVARDAFIVRPESPRDFATVARVHRTAFGGGAEADLVDALRRSDSFVPGLSLLATEGEEVVGHILFSRIRIKDEGINTTALALAPLAVLPQHQGRGIGSALVEWGLAESRRLGNRVVVVLGHPEYYPRFGFTPAEVLGIHSPFPVRPEAFMVCSLVPGALEGVRGEVEYPPEFEPGRV